MIAADLAGPDLASVRDELVAVLADRAEEAGSADAVWADRLDLRDEYELNREQDGWTI